MTEKTRKFLPFLILLLPVLIYAPFIGKVAFQLNSQYSDLIISHLPNAVFVNRSILQAHQLPLWNGTLMAGYPFIADPLSGIWYLPQWLANLLPLPISFNILFCLHIVLAGVGMYLFLTGEGVKKLPALIGALTLQCLPKTWAHFAAGHVTLVYAFCWTPWLLYFAQQHWRKRRKFQGISLEAIVLAVIVVCDVRWAAYAAILWAAVTIHLVSKSNTLKRTWSPWKRFFTMGYQWIIHLSLKFITAVLLSACFVVPFLEYLSLSTRSAMSASQNLYLSLPPSNLLNLPVPNFGGNAEWILYIGGLAVILLIYCLADRSLRRKTAIWWVIFFVSTVFSLGSYVPGLSAFYSLPVVNFLRVPARMNFIAGFAICCLAGIGIDTLFAVKRSGRTFRLIFLACVFATLLLTVGVSLLTHKFAFNFLWAAICLSLSMLLVELWSKNKINLVWLGSAAVALIFFDLMGNNLLSIRFDSVQKVRETDAAIISMLPADSVCFRIYSPSFSISQLAASTNGLQLVNGVSPMQMEKAANFITQASGVPNEAYSVTLPTLATGDPTTDNAAYDPDPVLLGKLSTKYVIAAFPLTGSGLELLVHSGSLWLYENASVLPRARMLSGNTAEFIKNRPNKIVVRATGPGLLVLSEINYPGWVAEINGQVISIQTYQDVFRSVELPSGTFDLTFSFHPISLYIGIAISGFSFLLFIVYLVINKKKKTKKTHENVAE